MPIFAIPYVLGSKRSAQRAHLDRHTTTKRKRASLSPTPDIEDLDDAVPSTADETPALSAAITNPLSLTPAEIHQYRVAGLALDQNLPSAIDPHFPHRALPQEDRDTSILLNHRSKDAGSPEDGREKTPEPARLRERHLGVLTTIMHRCLLEGDIARASRAWALLLRSQFGGLGVELRGSGYWGVGAELLMREGESAPRGLERLGLVEGHGEDDIEGDLSNGSNGSNGEAEIQGEGGGSYIDEDIRWGSAAGLRRAKEYYERLILQYPYRRQFHDSVNALDFWPAMLGCEIYGIQYEQKTALASVAARETNDDALLSDATASDDGNDEADNADFFAPQRRREQRRRDKFWKKREEIRKGTLAAAEQVAGRMDGLMGLPPYSDSHVLHRLRGMLALYIGDLAISVESEPFENDGDYASHGMTREIDRETGIYRRREERARARKAFRRARECGGKIDNELRELSSGLNNNSDDGDDDAEAF
ncbi:MAG: hypothetical protein M1818_006261 [Claussenomyces sp. TS43310]|nr:MAG: hypothetical protein M1818_006261 [Claussenomyces sp. TS43310]